VAVYLDVFCAFMKYILGLLLYARPLDCHRKVELASYMTPLSLATNIVTKLSPNEYRAIFCFCRWFWYICLFYGLPWDNRKTKKNAIPRYWSPSGLTTSPVWGRNKLSISNYYRMTITILVPVILWCTLGLELRHPNEVFVELVYIDLGSKSKTLLCQAE